MAKVLVTGACGFIGSHLVEALVKDGHDVRALVYYNAWGSQGWMKYLDSKVRTEIEIVIGDIRDPFGANKWVSGCSRVAHLAALIGIPYSYSCPSSYVDTNINGTLNLLEASRSHEVELFVQTSTSEVYGTPMTVPILEDHPLVGQSPYSASKIAADQMAISYNRSFELPLTIIRPFNTYGPRQSARAIIPTILSQIIDGKKELALGDLRPTRDFNYVEDTVRGFVCALNSAQSGGEVIQLATGFDISMGNLLELILEVTGNSGSISVRRDEQRIRPEKSEVMRLQGDAKKAKEILDWAPKYQGIEGLKKGIAATFEWLKLFSGTEHYRSDQYQV